MNRLSTTFRTLIRMRHPYTDPFEMQRAQSLWRMVWGVTVIGLITVLGYIPFFAPDLLLNLGVELWLVVLGMIIVLVLINRGSLLSATVLFVVELFAGTVLSYLLVGSQANLIAFSIPIIAAGVLINRRGMIVMLILTLAALLLSNLLTSVNALPTGVVLAPSAAIINTVLTLAVGGIILIVFSGGQRTLLRQNLTLTRELRNSATLAQTVAAMRSLDELLDQAVRLIRDQLDFYHVQIFLFEEKTQLLVLRAGTTLVSGRSNTEQRRIAPDDEGVINRVARSRIMQQITLGDSLSRRSELLAAMQSELTLPLAREDTLLGVLDIQSADVDSFTGQNIEVLQAMAAQLAVAVQNTHLTSDLKLMDEEHQRLSKQMQAVALETDQLNQEVSGQLWASYFTGRGDAAIGYDWGENGVTKNAESRPSLDRGLTSTTPQLVTDGAEQVLSVPIVSRGQVLGIMEFRTPLTRSWNSRSLELAQVISERLALALDNLRLFEQAQVIARREQLVSKIGADLQAKTDIDSLITVAAEAFQEALGASRTNVRLGIPQEKTIQDGRHS
jgi:GAF domain-containing protein